MKTGTKFWLAVGIIAAMILLALIYILKAGEKVDGTVLGAELGVITLVAGGYFTANVAASGQATAATIAQANSTQPPKQAPADPTAGVPGS
jgi:hypothetical protein